MSRPSSQQSHVRSRSRSQSISHNPIPEAASPPPPPTFSVEQFHSMFDYTASYTRRTTDALFQFLSHYNENPKLIPEGYKWIGFHSDFIQNPSGHQFSFGIQPKDCEVVYHCTHVSNVLPILQSGFEAYSHRNRSGNAGGKRRNSSAAASTAAAAAASNGAGDSPAKTLTRKPSVSSLDLSSLTGSTSGSSVSLPSLVPPTSACGSIIDDRFLHFFDQFHITPNPLNSPGISEKEERQWNASLNTSSTPGATATSSAASHNSPNANGPYCTFISLIPKSQIDIEFFIQSCDPTFKFPKEHRDLLDLEVNISTSHSSVTSPFLGNNKAIWKLKGSKFNGLGGLNEYCIHRYGYLIPQFVVFRECDQSAYHETMRSIQHHVIHQLNQRIGMSEQLIKESEQMIQRSKQIISVSKGVIQDVYNRKFVE